MPSSTKDPDLLREQIKGSFSFRQSEDSPWIDVLFKVGDEGPFADEEDDEEEEDYAENLEDPGSDQNPKPRADDTDAHHPARPRQGGTAVLRRGCGLSTVPAAHH